MSKVIGEVWKPIPNYEGFYEVSNIGRVRSLYRYKKILHPSDTNGYRTVELWKGKKRKRIGVHRLVAMAFIDNPDNKPFVNHKDETRDNNSVDNLEWATHLENCRYGTAIARRTAHLDYSKRHINNAGQILACSKPIIQYDKNGNYIREWKSATECSKKTGFSISGIRSVVRGKRNSIFGYVFKERSDDLSRR